MADARGPSAPAGDGHTYTQVSITDSARAHLGNAYYTVNGSLFVGQSDLQALTAPSNVSTAAKYLSDTSTNILSHVTATLPGFRDGNLFTALGSFQGAIRKLLPISILASMSRERAALLPATDLVAVISEAVKLFMVIDESVSQIGRKTGSPQQKDDMNADFARQCDKWAVALERVNSVLLTFLYVLQCDSDAEANLKATQVHGQVNAEFAEHQLLPIFTELSAAGTMRDPSLEADSDHQSERTVKYRPRPHQAGLPHGPQSIFEQIVENSKPLPRSWKRDFEDDLMRSAVYTRNARRDRSISTLGSTITAYTCSILSHLTLADVSVVSVLRLPVKIHPLERASYDLQGRQQRTPSAGLDPGTELSPQLRSSSPLRRLIENFTADKHSVQPDRPPPLYHGPRKVWLQSSPILPIILLRIPEDSLHLISEHFGLVDDAWTDQVIRRISNGILRKGYRKAYNTLHIATGTRVVHMGAMAFPLKWLRNLSRDGGGEMICLIIESWPPYKFEESEGVFVERDELVSSSVDAIGHPDVVVCHLTCADGGESELMRVDRRETFKDEIEIVAGEPSGMNRPKNA